MAGHSKWANIQHRKGRQDAARSKLFSKLAKEITIAAKMGEPDPDKNPRLRLALKAARSHSLPEDVIARALRKAQRGEAGTYAASAHECYGPGGAGDAVVRLQQYATLRVPGGLDHAQVSAPGYGMYYLWVVRHLKGNPYLGFEYTPEHEWVLDSKTPGWEPPK